MTAPIGYGVIGCGGHAVQGHIQPAAGSGMALVGVYDPDQACAEKAAADAGAAVHDSVEALLRDEAVEAVLITSPDRFHPAQLAAAVQAGKHVLVDKPLAVDAPGLDVVRRALHRAADTGLTVSGCHPRRFDPPYAALKDRLPALVAEFGPLVRIEMDFSYHAPAAQWKHARSLLLDHFPHEVDTLRWLLGDVAVSAHRLVDGPDRYEVVGVADGGVTFLCAGTRRLSRRVYPEVVRLRLSSASLTVNSRIGAADLYRHGADTTQVGVWPRTDYDLRAAAVMADFAAAVRGGRGYLSAADLWVNTESAVALAGGGFYRTAAAKASDVCNGPLPGQGPLDGLEMP